MSVVYNHIQSPWTLSSVLQHWVISTIFMHNLTMYILGNHHREHICTYLSTFMEMSCIPSISINTESLFPPLYPAMILYLLLFLLVWLSPVASDWPWSYAVQGVTHYSWILFHLLLCNIIKFKPRISKFCTIYNHLYFCCWVEAVKTSIYMILKYVIYFREML